MANKLQSALDCISRISHELQQAGDMLLTAVNNSQVGQSMATKLEIARRQCLDVLLENNYGKTGQSDIQRSITVDNLDDELLLQIFSRLPTLANVMKCRAVYRRWHRVIESGIDSGQFYCCRVVSKETVGRAMGLLDLLQVLPRLRKHLQELELETLAVLNHDNPYLWEPFRILLSDMPRLKHLGVLFEVVDRKVFLALMRTFSNPQGIKSLHIRQQPISKLKEDITPQYGFCKNIGQSLRCTYYDDEMSEERSPYRESLARKTASRELMNKFLRHFSFLEELHLCGFQDWPLLKVQYVGVLEWPPNLQVLKIEDGIDVGFVSNHWRFAGNVFANLAALCSALRELRIVVSPTDFVLADLVKLFRSLESLDLTFEPIHSFVNYEPNCEISVGIEIIAPNLRFLRMSTESKITQAILSVLSGRAPRLTEIELFGSVDQTLLQPLTHFPALECLTLSRLDDSVTDDDLCLIFAPNYQLKEFRLHFAPSITMEIITFLLLQCKELKRLDIFELENVSMMGPEDILNSISAGLKAREHNPVLLELHTDVQLAEKLTNALMPPGLSVSVLELSRHRFVFLKYIYKKT
ncbi:hypothetical protein Ddc_13611 [Ditylenchus destructor]|nr:hypothetical protein Ddc_13611 [Ditylenchus destructor]